MFEHVTPPPPHVNMMLSKVSKINTIVVHYITCRLQILQITANLVLLSGQVLQWNLVSL